MKFLSSLGLIQTISNIETVFNKARKLCRFKYTDELTHRESNKFVLFSSILPLKYMSSCFSSAKVKRRKFINLNLFLRNTHTKIREKLRRPVPQAQTENLSREDFEKQQNNFARKIRKT